jgi:hypothetical protein
MKRIQMPFELRQAYRPSALPGESTAMKQQIKGSTHTHWKHILATGLWLGALASAFAQTNFTKNTTGPVVTDKGSFAGAAWGDFHGLGFLDLMVCDYNGGTNVYYRNNGDGTFAKITQGDPVQRVGYSVGPAAGDLNNNGHLDLLVTTDGDSTGGRNMLYHNNGDGTFTAFNGWGVTNLLGYFNGCAVADYDNDGLVDMYIPGLNGTTSLLFHNNGDGAFSRVPSGPEVSTPVDNHSVSWADYDGDGFMDLLVNGDNRNLLYHNNRDGTFTQVLTNAVATDFWSYNPWGSSWGDYDNDGLPDLFVAGMQMGNRLYHNNGNGVFTNVTSGFMLLPPAGGGSLSCAWGDYDNDGYLDLLVCSYNATNRLFHNNGDGTFTQVLGDAPVTEGNPSISCHCCGWADYDNDGCLDLFVTRGSDSGAPVSNLLYHNNGNTNAWLEVKLAGQASNRSAIGAKVRVHATIRGKTFWQMREVGSSCGRWVQPLVAHFGLGDAANVDTLRIEWPSGIVQTLSNIAPRQILTIVEHQVPPPTAPPSFTSVSPSGNGSLSLSVSGDSGLLYVLEGSTNLTNWAWLQVRSNATGTVQFTDLHGSNYPRRFYRVSVP